MKTIVCYGDSNTWGFMPKKTVDDWTVNRFEYDVRWPGILRSRLGPGYIVEEEGLNGRTTYVDDPQDEHRNGLRYIDTCLLTKMPVDLVILMLGTNDVKEFLGLSPLMISRGIGALIQRIQKGGYGKHGVSPEILVIAPARLGKNLKNCWPGEEFGEHALQKDAALAAYYSNIAKEYGTHYLDASVLTADDADCVHLNEDGHRKLGEMVAAKVKEILG